MLMIASCWNNALKIKHVTALPDHHLFVIMHVLDAVEQQERRNILG